MADILRQSLAEEIAVRARRGEFPVTIRTMEGRFAALGYTIDRDDDCRGWATHLTGEDAGRRYPVVSQFEFSALRFL